MLCLVINSNPSSIMIQKLQNEIHIYRAQEFDTSTFQYFKIAEYNECTA